jgi:hypothetical protein
VVETLLHGHCRILPNVDQSKKVSRATTRLEYRHRGPKRQMSGTALPDLPHCAMRIVSFNSEKESGTYVGVGFDLRGKRDGIARTSASIPLALESPPPY